MKLRELISRLQKLDEVFDHNPEIKVECIYDGPDTRGLSEQTIANVHYDKKLDMLFIETED